MGSVALQGAILVTPWSEIIDRILIVKDHRIDAILSPQELPNNVPVLNLEGRYLTPGFIDLQVNGGGGFLFNDEPSAECARAIADAHRPFGTTSLLPTLISDTYEQMRRAYQGIDEAITHKIPGVLGLHLEGPYLNKQRSGIHAQTHFRNPSDDEIALFTSGFPGPFVMTIAPETLNPGTLKRLASTGVKLSAGHTAATYEETVEALENGVTGFTHLFNAMPPLGSRAPGPVAAALESNAWCSLIADGHHVSAAMLRLALRSKKDGRVMFVSDAMPSVGTSATTFSLYGEKIDVKDGRCVDAQGTLAGAHLTMLDAVRFGVQQLSLSRVEAVRMATYEPACFLGIEHTLGQIKVGARADLLCLDEHNRITGMLSSAGATGDLCQD